MIDPDGEFQRPVVVGCQPFDPLIHLFVDTDATYIGHIIAQAEAEDSGPFDLFRGVEGD